MKITLNPSRPERAKLHMECAWHLIFRNLNGETHKFKDWGLTSIRHPDGSIETKELVS